MAANSKGRALAGILGNRFITKVWGTGARDPTAAAGAVAVPAFGAIRGVHVSSYDKNVEEQVRPAVVPDHVIDSATKSDKFWGPHPTTGVFGPVDENSRASSEGQKSANGEPTVLDQTAWFRPLTLEDVDKSSHA